MAMIILEFIFYILIFIFSVLYYKRIFNPIGFMLFFFLIGLFLANIGNDMSSQVMKEGNLWIFIGIVFFTASYFCGQVVSEKNQNRRVKTIKIQYDLKWVNFLINVCCIASVAGLFISLAEVLPIAGSIGNVFRNSTWIRVQYLNRETGFFLTALGLLSSMLKLSFACLFPVATKSKLRYSRAKLIFVVVINASSSLITMSKDGAVLFVVILVAAYLDDSPSLKNEIRFLKKNIKWVLIFLIVIFGVVAIQRTYVGTKSSSLADAVIGTFSDYFAVPIVSFSKLITSGINEFAGGIYSFRPIVNILSRFGLTSHVDIKQSIVGASSGNVYTMFGTMYRDYGLIGIPFVSIIYGIVCGILYKKNHSGKLKNRIFNAMVTMVFAFAYYDFKFIQTVYIAILLLAFFTDKILSPYLYEKYHRKKSKHFFSFHF